MTVAEMMEMLSQLPGDAEVRIAHQPRYPLALSVKGVVAEVQMDSGARDSDIVSLDCPELGELYVKRVWIAAGDSPYDEPYARRDVWEFC